MRHRIEHHLAASLEDPDGFMKMPLCRSEVADLAKNCAQVDPRTRLGDPIIVTAEGATRRFERRRRATEVAAPVVDHASVLDRAGALGTAQHRFRSIKQLQGTIEITQAADDEGEARPQAGCQLGFSGTVSEDHAGSKLALSSIESAQFSFGEANHPMEAHTFRNFDRNLHTSAGCLFTDPTRIDIDLIAQLRHAHPRESVH